MTARRDHDSVTIDIRGNSGPGLRAGLRHHPHGRVEPGVSAVLLEGWCDRSRGWRTVQGAEQGAPGTSWFNTRTVTVAEAGESSPSTGRGPGIGSYTWRYVFEPTPTGTRITDSYKAERPVPKAMNRLTEIWVGSRDRDADLREGMKMTLERIKTAAESAERPTS